MKTVFIWFLIWGLCGLVLKLQKFEIRFDFSKFPSKKSLPKKLHRYHQLSKLGKFHNF